MRSSLSPAEWEKLFADEGQLPKIKNLLSALGTLDTVSKESLDSIVGFGKTLVQPGVSTNPSEEQLSAELRNWDWYMLMFNYANGIKPSQAILEELVGSPAKLGLTMVYDLEGFKAIDRVPVAKYVSELSDHFVSFAKTGTFGFEDGLDARERLLHRAKHIYQFLLNTKKIKGVDIDVGNPSKDRYIQSVMTFICDSLDNATTRLVKEGPNTTDALSTILGLYINGHELRAKSFAGSQFDKEEYAIELAKSSPAVDPTVASVRLGQLKEGGIPFSSLEVGLLRARFNESFNAYFPKGLVVSNGILYKPQLSSQKQ